MVPILVALLAGSPAHACLWDRDTLQAELEGLPTVEQAILGNIPRHSASFYERRQMLAKTRIQWGEEDTLEHYDDVAVASDRLHDSATAIEWMAAKLEAMERLEEPADSEHRYRYHANLGTFLAHAAIREGRLTDLPAAIAHIDAALAINPNAHFGREAVQRDILLWLGAPEARTNSLPTFASRWFEPGPAPRGNTDQYNAHIEGLVGLMVLGAAWESIDVLVGLRELLVADGRQAVAVLAQLRIDELVETGHTSLVSDARGEELLRLAKRPLYGHDRSLHDHHHFQTIEYEFVTGRNEARLAQLERRMYEGDESSHPDSHPDAWRRRQAALHARQFRRIYATPIAGTLGLLFGGVFGGAFGLLISRLRGSPGSRRR